MKRKILFLLLTHVFFIHAQTTVSGTLTSNTIWTKAGSPYNLTGTLGVFDGVTLTIESGVEVSGNFDLLIKGIIKVEGKSNEKVVFNNTRLIFKDSNLSNSTVDNVVFSNGSGIQLADEGEHNQDPIKNSGTLLVSSSDFNNGTYARTKGYATSAKLRLSNCNILNATIKGFYPRSEEIEINQCNIKGGVLNSDSYNDGIFLTNSKVEDANFRIGCCGANFNIDSCEIVNSNFEDYNNYYSVTINNSLVSETLFNLQSGELVVSNSLLESPNQLQDYHIKSRNVNFSNVIFKGKNSGKALKILNKDFTSSIQNCTFTNYNTGVVLNSSFDYTSPKADKINKKNTYNFTFKNNNLIAIQESNFQNNFNANIDATQNYWGTDDESVIADKITDGLDNINYGIVNYSNFLTSPTSSAPVEAPNNVFKGSTNGGVLVSWDASVSNNVDGYKVYYKTNSTEDFQLLADVNNVTSYLTDVVSINSIIVVKSYSTEADGSNDYIEGNESDFSENAQSVIDSVVLSSAKICHNDNLNLSFSSNYGFVNNEFILQMSDVNGSFDMPLELARITTANEGFSVPFNDAIEFNKTYFIRIVSTENNFLSENLEVIFKDEINAEFTISTASVCAGNTVNIEYLGEENINNTLNWNFNGATVVSGEGVGPYELFWNESGEKEITLEVLSDGCSSVATKTIQIVNKPLADFSVSENVCQGESTLITYNGNATEAATFSWNFDGASIVSGTGIGPYEVTWNESYGEKNISLVVSENGCTSEEITKTINHNPNPTGSIELVEQVCLGDTTTITYVGDAQNDAVYNWNFNGGYIISGSGAGPYEIQWYNQGEKNVSLAVTQNGCSVSMNKTVTVTQTPNSYFYLSNYSICGEGTVKVHYYGNGDDGSTYNWDFDGAEVISGEGKGPYEITWNNNYGQKVISLNVSKNGCTSQTNTQILQFNQLPSLSIEGESSVCKGELYNIEYTGENYTNIYWSFDGAEVISGSGAGPYVLRWNTSGNKNISYTVYNNSCSRGEVFNVNVKESIDTPEICVVTVDEDSFKNKIIWDYYAENLSQFAVYKETAVAGQYQLLSYVNSDVNYYIDESSSPAQSASLYKISAIDNCGGETELGAYHKTIHLVLTPGIGTSWNMIWNDYEGFEFYTYRIHRSINGGAFELLTEVSSNLNSYTDLNVSSPNVAYYIEVVSNTSCGGVFNERNQSSSYISSKSNVATTSETLSVSDVLLKELKIGPNPVKDILVISTSSLELQEFELYTTLGQKLKSNEFDSEHRIDLRDLPNGTYFLRLITNRGSVVKKIIKK